MGLHVRKHNASAQSFRLAPLRLRNFFRDNRREYLDRFQKSEDVIIPSCNQGYRLRMLMGATVNKARKIPAFQPNDWNY